MLLDAMTKGQSQVVSAVLLGGILVVGISSAYTWAVPVLQKNQDTDQLQSSLESMQELQQAVERVSTRGGSETVTMQLNGGLLSINPATNSVNYTIGSQAAYVATEWVPLNENDMLGIGLVNNSEGYGIVTKDKPGVLIGKAVPRGDSYQTIYHLEFRELQDLNSDTGYLINLTDGGNLQKTSGTAQIVIEKQGQDQRLEGQSKENGVLVVRNVGIRVE